MAHEKTAAGLSQNEVGAQITGQFNVLRRRWRVIGLCMLLALGLSGIVLVVTTPRYTATAQILLDPRKQNVLQNQAVVQGINLDASMVESEVSLLQSFNVARRVVDKLSLDKDPEYNAFATGSMFGRALGAIGLAGPAAAANEAIPAVVKDQIPPATLAAVQRLRLNTAMRRVGITLVLDVSATSKVPEKAAAIANALTDAYLVDQLEARFEAAKRASGWLNERLSNLRQTVQDSERRVGEHRAKYGLVETTGGGIDKQQVSELSAQIALSRAAVAEKNAKFEQAQRITRTGGNIASVAEVLQSSVVSNLRAQEAEVARREADLSTKYGDRHPQVVNVRAELTDIRRGINSEVQRIVSNLKNEYEVAQKREQSLQESLERLTGVATQSDEVRIRLRELERDAESNRNLFQSFLSRFKETREQTTLDTADSRVITPAVTPSVASSPRYLIVSSAALFLGFAFGVLGAFLLEFIENGFMTVEQAEAMLGVPVLAVLPGLEKNEYDPKNAGHSIPGYVVAKPLSRFSEAIRTVRVAVSLSNVDQPPRLVLVTSSVPGEGKSTFAASFASSAAASGQRTLLIDGDLRHPSTSKLFGLEKHYGMTELLGSSVEPAQILQQFQNGYLTVLPAGSATKNSPDLLGSQKMQQLLRKFRDTYDIVVIDTPPVTAVVDSLVIANQVDKIVFVIEWENTPREVVQRAFNVLAENRERIVGCVLNKANIAAMRYHSTYYGYYSSYYHKRYDKYYVD